MAASPASALTPILRDWPAEHDDFPEQSRPEGGSRWELPRKDYECEIWDLTGESASGSVTGKIWRSDKVPGGMVETEMNMTTPGGAGVMKILLKEITPAP